ncbi:MAG TPA: hypothetical protein VFV75_07310, partial [Candidatus Polarisedimenticolaceae bacterium]|nr:hypothetical protein [Candidatus Polarisedimenticolaceae bacterium]
TVQLYVTLRNSSGSDRQGIVVRMASTEDTVACIPTPVVSFGSLLSGETREGAVPLVFRVADVTRIDPFVELPATLEFAISGDDFGATTHPQEVTLEVDVTGGFLPTSYSEGFESGTFGSFTTQSLDIGRESQAASNGFRCQYSDPDFANSNSYGSTQCFLGAPVGAQNAYDWHVHGLASPDGGRAYLGNNALHWGLHPSSASMDTTRLRQLDAIRITNTVNLGWNGVASELSFKHQVGLADCDYFTCTPGQAIDRGVVQVQPANAAGIGQGRWRKLDPYQNVYDHRGGDRYSTCMFDPTDDGNDEDDYFEPNAPYRRLGPSSTCYPEFVFSRQGAIAYNAPFDESDIGGASDGPGLQGVRGPGTWVETKFNLQRYRGHRIRLRFLATSMEIGPWETMQQASGWNPILPEIDDGWYIDDVRITNTLTSAATISVDTADRSGLPVCGPVCTSVTPSLVAPAAGACGEELTLDASGSTADQCPEGALQFRFWWIWDPQDPGELSNGHDPTLLQDWNENGIISHRLQTLEGHPYRVDVRCSTRPACGASTTAVVMVDPACPVISVFPYTLGFDSNSVLSWGAPALVELVRGDLHALRAGGGDFAVTIEDVFGSGGSSFVDDFLPNPAPGEGKYYLARGGRRHRPSDDCTNHSWSTGSAAEVPGAGGNRDQDIGSIVGSDPEPCP